jgi:transcriptional regulator with XRE-family HTH domain
MAKPTPQRVELGLLLKQYRERAGLQQEPIETALGWHQGKFGRVEQGIRIVVMAEIGKLIELLGVSADEADVLRLVAEQARKRESSSLLPDWAEKLVAMERTAFEIRWYDPEVITGMFQTKGYASAMLAPSGRSDWQEVVQARMNRHGVLIGARPPRVWSVLGEAGLYRKLGGDEGLREQLEHLLELGKLPNVTIQVLPFDVGAHPALGVGFTHLRFKTPTAERAYIEGLTNGTWLHDSTDTKAYLDIFSRVQDLALDARRSATMIRARIKELR